MIGIITPYKTVNYGTKLQAYAMQKLMEKYDSAELIGFVSATDRRMGAVIGKIYLKIIRKFQKRKKLNQTADMKLRVKAINEFDAFYRFGKSVKGNKELKKELSKYHAVVCGSDQLWAPSNVIADYFTLTIIPDGIKKFSYAASFGISEVPIRLRRKYGKFLNRLDFISVREEQGKKIVKEVAAKEAQVVLDPTLMLNREEWEQLVVHSKIKLDCPYVFCYFLGANQEHRDFAKKLATELGIKIVSFPHFKGWNAADDGFGDVPLYNAGPIEFLNLIKNADYVCMDSFHGTVFSVIFERQIAVFERFQKDSSESTNSRIYTLLNSLGLHSQLFESINGVQTFINNKIDYDNVLPKLYALRNDSYIFLDKALGKKRRE